MVNVDSKENPLPLSEKILKEYKLAKRYVNKIREANDRKIEFGLTFNQFKNILSREKCPFSGRLMNDIDGHPDQKTLDRIDASKGYVTGNVIACTHRINSLKGNLTSQEMLNIVRIVNRKGSKL